MAFPLLGREPVLSFLLDALGGLPFPTTNSSPGVVTSLCGFVLTVAIYLALFVIFSELF